MPRPCKRKRVGFMPMVKCFVPVGKGDLPGREQVLTVEELEAVRLKDLLGYDQEICALRMNVGPSTFQRMLYNARLKIATSLINGQGITIQGGNYYFAGDVMGCRHCGSPLGKGDGDDKGTTPGCPRCAGGKRGRRG